MGGGGKGERTRVVPALKLVVNFSVIFIEP